MHSTSSFLALFAAGLVAVTATYTTPTHGPEGNPISKPGLQESVPVCKPYEVTWEPTTEGTVTIVLLRGPSENILPLYPIAEKIENTGTFSWTPSYDLEDDETHYGLQIIVDSDGQFQWSTQFGISNPNYKEGDEKPTACPGEEPSTTSSSKTTSASTSDSEVTYKTEVVTAYTTYCPEPTTVVMENKTYTVTSATTLTITDCPCTITHTLESTTSDYKPTTYVASTGYPVHNSSIVRPTGTLTVPSSLRTVTPDQTADGASATTESAPTSSFTGAATHALVNTGALVGAAVFAVLAF